MKTAEPTPTQAELKPEILDVPKSDTACVPKEPEQHVSLESESVCIEVSVAPENSLDEDSDVESLFDTPVECQLRRSIKIRSKTVLRHKELIKSLKRTKRELDKQREILQDQIDEITGKRRQKSKRVSNEKVADLVAGPSGSIEESDCSPSSLEVSDNSEVEIFDSPVETKLRHKFKRITKLYKATCNKKKLLTRKKLRRLKQNAVLEKQLEDLKKMTEGSLSCAGGLRKKK